MIALSPSQQALAVGVPYPFGASGGTPPYAFSLLSGPGSIDPVTGLYTAPGAPGTAVVQVVDSLAAAAQSQVSILTPLELVCDIIQQEMTLAPGRVYQWDQKIMAPTDAGLFVALGILNVKPFSNSLNYDSSGAGLNSVQSVNMNATVTMDIISRDASARDQKELVLLALASQYAENQMALNNFRIFNRSQSFVNLSQIEGAAIPYRFSISFQMQYAVVKTKAVPYFDTFASPSVTTEP